MKYPGFVGSSYQTQATSADVERTVNFYVEQFEAEQAKARNALYPTPGFLSFAGPAAGITDVGERGSWAGIVSGVERSFWIFGTGLYELTANATITRRGTVAQDSNPATFSFNGNAGGHLFITSGGNGYCYVLSTNVLSAVLTGEATQGAFLDGYFLAFNILNGKVRLSGLNDGTTWDPLIFFQRSIAADPWQAMVADRNRQVWMFGRETTEVWYDGNPASAQPFLPVGGAVFGSGIASPWAAAVAGLQIIWLERAQEGVGRVMAARGYVPQRISTYAVELAVAGYARTSTIGDAEALVYQDQGHTFYNLNFPTANVTRTVDVDTGLWHERGAWNPTQNRYDLWKPRTTSFAFGRHLVGDRSSGTIAAMDVTYGSEADGSAIRRLRRAPGLNDEKRPHRYDRLELLMDTGLGLSSGQGSDPVILLRVSRDGGRTWGNERSAGFGRQGQYRKRVYWSRIGASDDVVFEIVATDPVPTRIVDAWLNNAGNQQAAA